MRDFSGSRLFTASILRFRILLFALALAHGSPAASAAANSDQVDQIVRRQMELNRIPGAAVAIVEQGRVIKIAAYGTANIEWDTPVGLDTRFQLASATKMFTGLLLMRLVEQKKLRLDDPLTRWFPNAPASWSSIRVRQLADHTSGLAEQFGATRDAKLDKIVATAMADPLAYAPGTEARYGFTDFAVLRAVIEKAGGDSLPRLMTSELFDPLGLRETGFANMSDDGTVRIGDIVPRRVQIYGLQGDRLTISDFFFAPQGYGAGGLYSSIGDLAKLFAAIDEGRLLRPDSLSEVEMPATLANGQRAPFGLGWIARRYRGTEIAGHSGGPALADIWRAEDRKLTVIALTNQQVQHPLLAEAIMDMILPPVPPEPIVADNRPEIAANIRAAVVRAAAGDDSAAANAFAPSGKKAADSLVSPFARAMLRGMGQLQTVELIEVRPDGERRYRLGFAHKAVVWLASAEADGRLSRFRPE
ncbi:serine hydrolase domain-containing protein [Sphingopyxis sp. OAS728]|uniref:serine hydrolase domain-containing protein n=1 Tax=Sphingopyxis sp. OAS728 TaxID=2663823 RepID=UPI001CEF0E7B|nr:serine hydrolase domain-containing protein [Sphingopyxis sp. OAS728]